METKYYFDILWGICVSLRDGACVLVAGLGCSRRTSLGVRSLPPFCRMQTSNHHIWVSASPLAEPPHQSWAGLNENSLLTPSWWNYLGRVRRSGLVGEGISLSVSSEVSNTHGILSENLCFFFVNQDVNSELLPTCLLPRLLLWEWWTPILLEM